MSNVIDLFAARKQKPQVEPEVESTDLDTIAEKNRKNAERLRKEREQANKSVLRSYHIKP